VSDDFYEALRKVADVEPYLTISDGYHIADVFRTLAHDMGLEDQSQEVAQFMARFIDERERHLNLGLED
jgi:hypothetical protein